METTSFEKHTGKKAELKILEEARINSGGYGIVFDALVEIGGHKKRFIIKKYYENKYEPAKESASKAFENYTLAKKAGLKVFPTFRIGEDGKSILMTSGFTENQICIGSNSDGTNVKSFEEPLIKNIDNLDEFLRDYYTEGIKVIESNFSLAEDVPFFIVSKNKPTKLDFVWGDLDNLAKPTIKLNKNHAHTMLSIMKNTLEKFMDNNISEDEREKFLERSDYYFNLAQEDVNFKFSK